MGLIPGLERSLGGGNGNPLQYSCLENPIDRGSQRLQGRKESDMSERLNNNSRTCLWGLCHVLPRGFSDGISWNPGLPGLFLGDIYGIKE